MKRSKKILVLLVPVIAAALHYLYLAPFLFSLRNKVADHYVAGITLVIFAALVIAIANAMED